MTDLPNLPLVRMTTGGLFEAVDLKSYPDGMPLVTDRANNTAAILLRPRNLFDFMAAMFWVDALAERGKRIPPLVLPNIPGARQDRLNLRGDFLFTAKSIAKQLNARNFPRVVVLDPHSEVSAGLIDRCDVHQLKWQAELCDSRPYANRWTGFIVPDGGAEKRVYNLYTQAVEHIPGLSFNHGGKKRNVETGVITAFWVDTLAPGHYLVVDDLCDGGGTFLGLGSEILDNAEVSADLVVTHGLFTQGTKKLLATYERLFCTDSTLDDKPGVHILPYCKQLLRESVL